MDAAITKKAWTINVTLVVDTDNDGLPPTMVQLETLFYDHGFHLAMPRSQGDYFVLIERK